MAAHEDDEKAKFVKLGFDFSTDGDSGKENWPTLITVLQFFAITGQWPSTVERVASDPHPIALKEVRKLLRDEDA